MNDESSVQELDTRSFLPRLALSFTLRVKQSHPGGSVPMRSLWTANTLCCLLHSALCCHPPAFRERACNNRKWRHKDSAKFSTSYTRDWLERCLCLASGTTGALLYYIQRSGSYNPLGIQFQLYFPDRMKDWSQMHTVKQKIIQHNSYTGSVLIFKATEYWKKR